jgi:hypothetical protein
MHCQKKYYVFLIATLLAFSFGYWFTQQQLFAVDSIATATYPNSFFALTIFKVSLTILIFYSAAWFYLGYFSRNKLNPVYIALSFAPLLLVFLNCSLPIIILSIALIQLALLISCWSKDDYRWLYSTHIQDVLALLIFFILHYVLTTRFSPSHANMAMLLNGPGVDEEIPVVATIYKSYMLAKQFVFTNFDYTAWAGVLNPPITLGSPLLQLLTLGANLPSLSVQDYHIVLSLIYFINIILGSFGCYLLLKYAGKISFLFALIGGCLFFFGGSAMLDNMFNDDGGIFVSSYAMFPYALLFMTQAFKKNSYCFAAWSGAALAAQFFLYSPHPEGIIYSGFFYGIFCIGLILFSSTLDWYKRFILVAISLLAFLVLSVFTIAPILIDKASGNMYVFAHINDASASTWIDTRRFRYLCYLFLPISFLFLYKQKRLTPFYLSSVMLAIVFLLYQYATSYLAVVEWLINRLHLGIHIWASWRVGIFFYTIVLVIVLSGLDGFSKQCMGYICNKFPSLLKKENAINS